MIDRSDEIALAVHIPCEMEVARLERELAEALARCAEAIAERDRWIARNRLLEGQLESIREIVR